MHDPESKDTFLTLTADLTDPRYETTLETRAREIRLALPDKAAQAAFADEFEAARKLARLGGGEGARGIAVFVSKEHALSERHALQESIQTTLVLDSSPYIRPLARFRDENAPFLLVLVDNANASIHLVEGGKAELDHKKRLDLIGHHKKGGMSQMRYQRHRQGIVDKMHNEIATRMQRLVDSGEADRIVVAGPGNAKRQLMTMLPESLTKHIIAVEDSEPDDTFHRFLDVAREHEKETSAENVAHLRTGLLRGDLALTGAFEVARAARDGRVDLLVVLKDHKVGGRKCEAHQSFFADSEACSCGNKGTQVDLINEAVQGAVRSDGEVEFRDARDPFMREIGGVGALLRW